MVEISTRMRWALFNPEGKQISKSHPDKLACMIEAFEKGIVVQARGRKFILEGYVIREVTS